ncbi:MAG: shikimate dehydrogenase [Clostridium sp.]
MITDGKTQVCGIIANPVEHSMSPLLQNLYAERTGINVRYVPFKVEESDVKAAIKGAFALNIRGLNVTVPHKQRVMPYLTEIDEEAEAVGAVNTLVRTETGYKGYNTDVQGLLRTVSEAGIKLLGRNCILIGAGGAAKAAAYMMAKEGATSIYLLNRSVSKAEDLATYINDLFGWELVHPMDLNDYEEIPEGKYFAVQSTSVGMNPHADDVPIEDPEFYKKISEAVEVIYTPAETRFMQMVREAGGRVVNGLHMLLYQGAAAFELWNPGVSISPDTIEEAEQMIQQQLVLNRERERLEKEKRNLILIGFMGAGKTGAGMCYAKKHGIPVVDTDRLIEMIAGMSVSDIFLAQGEEGFRRKETQTLKNLLDISEKSHNKTLISTGGGLPIHPENREVLKELGTVIYLKVSPETVLKRLAGDTTRPLLQGEDRKQKIEELLTFREPFYMEAADGVVETDGKDIEQIVEEIEKIEELRNKSL